MSTVCTNCGAALPLVFGRPADRCEYCRAPQPRAPTPPVHPIGLSPAIVPRKQSNAGCVIGMGAVVLVLMGAGVGFWVLFATRSAANVSATERARDNAPTPPVPVVVPIPSEPAKPKVDYFASPESAGTAIAERFTQNAELRELVLYPEYAVFELRQDEDPCSGRQGQPRYNRKIIRRSARLSRVHHEPARERRLRELRPLRQDAQGGGLAAGVAAAAAGSALTSADRDLDADAVATDPLRRNVARSAVL